MKIRKTFGNIWIGPGDDVAKICRRFMGEFSIDLGDIPISRPPSSYAILNVADDYPEIPHPPEVMYIHAGLNDGPEDWEKDWGQDNTSSQYLHAVYMLKVLLDGPWEVFVHCHGGVSRSSFVVACYMSWFLQIPYSESIKVLKAIYPRANPHPKHFKFAEMVVEGMDAFNMR